jgi:hypothetical protein
MTSTAEAFAAKRENSRTAAPAEAALSVWGRLAHLLKNRSYIGDVVYRGRSTAVPRADPGVDFGPDCQLASLSAPGFDVK